MKSRKRFHFGGHAVQRVCPCEGMSPDGGGEKVCTGGPPGQQSLGVDGEEVVEIRSSPSPGRSVRRRILVASRRQSAEGERNTEHGRFCGRGQQGPSAPLTMSLDPAVAPHQTSAAEDS